LKRVWLERRDPTADIDEVQIGNVIERATPRDNVYQPSGFFDACRRTQQQSVGYREDRGVRSDSDSERNDCGQRK
jgi:hypothetical protein